MFWLLEPLCLRAFVLKKFYELGEHEAGLANEHHAVHVRPGDVICIHGQFFHTPMGISMPTPASKFASHAACNSKHKGTKTQREMFLVIRTFVPSCLCVKKVLRARRA